MQKKEVGFFEDQKKKVEKVAMRHASLDSAMRPPRKDATRHNGTRRERKRASRGGAGREATPTGPALFVVSRADSYLRHSLLPQQNLHHRSATWD